MHIDRRRAIGAGLAVMALPLFHGIAGAKASRHFFDATRRPLGLQLYTLNGEFPNDTNAMLAAVAAAGYSRVETDFSVASAPAFRDSLARHGLAIRSAHLSPFDIADDRLAKLAATAEAARGMGLEFLGIPIFPFDAKKLTGSKDSFPVMLDRIAGNMGDEDWKNLAARLNRAGKETARAGVRFFYHNHNVEMRPVGNKTAFEILLDHTDPDLVSFEIDVGWIFAAGLDPFALLRRYKNRYRLAHLKDISADNRPNFALQQSPATVGAGITPWPKMLTALAAAGVTEYFVEQEPPFTTSRIDAARKGASHLLSL